MPRAKRCQIILQRFAFAYSNECRDDGTKRPEYAGFIAGIPSH